MSTRKTSQRTLSRRAVLLAATVSLALPFGAVTSAAAKDFVIGTILPVSGTFADQGRHYEDGMKLYQKLNGDTVGDLTVKMIVRDDQGPGSGDLSRRLTQELILREGADIIVGYSFTPNAMASAKMLNEAKKPAIVVNAATSSITQKSEYFARISMTMPMITDTLGKWAAKNGIKTAYTIVADYAPGIDAETWFIKGFEAGGGKILGSARTPVAEMEYAPYLQRAMEAKPDAIFAFNPGGDVSVAFMKQAGERGVTKAGIKLLVTGDVVDDNLLPAMGDSVDGVISAWHYQADIQNPANEKLLAGYREMFGADAVPSYRVVQGYDAMALIYQALEKTGGKTDTDSLMAAIKGAKLDSPRGPIMIDPETRDIVENVYIRRGEKKDGKWANIAFETVEAVKDPAKQ